MRENSLSLFDGLKHIVLDEQSAPQSASQCGINFLATTEDGCTLFILGDRAKKPTITDLDCEITPADERPLATSKSSYSITSFTEEDKRDLHSNGGAEGCLIAMDRLAHEPDSPTNIDTFLKNEKRDPDECCTIS